MGSLCSSTVYKSSSSMTIKIKIFQSIKEYYKDNTTNLDYNSISLVRLRDEPVLSSPGRGSMRSFKYRV